MTTVVRRARIEQGRIVLPLRVITRYTATYHIVDATGEELGAATKEAEAYRIRDEVQDTLAPKQEKV